MIFLNGGTGPSELIGNIQTGQKVRLKGRRIILLFKSLMKMPWHIVNGQIGVYRQRLNGNWRQGRVRMVQFIIGVMTQAF